MIKQSKLFNSYQFLYFGVSIILIFLSFFFIEVTPAEDASILFNYAENFCNTWSISYFPHGPVIEGYTDTLFMLILSSSQLFTKNIFLIAQLVSALSIFFTILLVFKSEHEKPKIVIVFLSFLLIFSPQIEATLRGYGTWFWAFSLSFSIFFFLKKNRQFFILSFFLCSLVRFESLIILSPLLIFDFYSSTEKLKYLKLFSLFFASPFLLFILVKWIYFGEVLPISFYITSISAFDERVFGLIYKNAFFTNYHFFKYYLIVPICFSGLIAILSRSKINTRQLIVLFSLLFVPFVLYSLFSQQMNLGFRYQMPFYLGMVYLFYFSFGNYRILYSSVLSLLLLLYTLYFGAKHIENAIFTSTYQHVLIAEEIASLGGRYKLLTTESGIYPWKLKWESVDAWGLNTQEYTTRLISTLDIEKFNPDVVVGNCKSLGGAFSSEKTWANMCGILNDNFNCNNLYTKYHVPTSTEDKGFLVMWVKKDFPLSNSISGILENHKARLVKCEY